MPKRTSKFMLFPAEGGVVTSTDEALLSPGQLQRGDNLIYDFQTNKKKRPGIDANYDNSVFLVDHRESTGTDRTLSGSFLNTGMDVGDFVTIVNASNNDYNGVLMEITDLTTTTITYTAVSSLTELSTTETTAAWGNKVIGGIDYWVELITGKLQYIISVLDNGMVMRTSGAARTRIPDTGTVWNLGTGLIQASCEVFNNKVMIAVDGTTNRVKMWDGTDDTNDLVDLPNAPRGSILRAHQGSLLMNDKLRLDRLHYSGAGDHTLWNGVGDSGAVDIGTGDGDPSGITGISPTFKGDIFIGKKSKLYRAVGVIPEVQLLKVSDGIGFISHLSITAVDQDDLYFVSDRGFHSMNATLNYGSFTSSYVSADIQKSFNQTWNQSRKSRIQSSYLPALNSVVFAVSENSPNSNNTLWLYNVVKKWWYRWPNQSCEALLQVSDADKGRVYLGQNNGRLAQTLTRDVFDIDQYGVNQAIVFDLITGILYCDNRPDTTKGFKRFGLIYKPEGNSTITVSCTIDRFSPQALSFDSDGGVDVLGTTFILGSSLLGSDSTLQTFAQSIDGYGRGIKVRIQQSGINDLADIQGLYVEYSVNGDASETRQGNDS